MARAAVKAAYDQLDDHHRNRAGFDKAVAFVRDARAGR